MPFATELSSWFHLSQLSWLVMPTRYSSVCQGVHVQPAVEENARLNARALKVFRLRGFSLIWGLV
jgi:hypothetical protein